MGERQGRWRGAQAAPITEAIVDLVGDEALETRAAPRYGRATVALVDTLAVALAGTRSEGATTARRALLDDDGGRATVFGTSRRAPLLDAVLCNGIAAHALDYDDTLQGLTTHPSCHLVPALLGLAEVVHPSGPAFLTSYLVGLEVEAQLSKTMTPSHYKAGWHTTGTVGTIAAAAAAARLLGLRGDAVADALGMACSSASGLRGNFGSMTKGLHVGHAARAGVEAALLARSGFTATHDPFEHQYGFLAAGGAPAGRPDPALWDLDTLSDLAAVEGLAFKLFPCCGEAAGTVEAAVLLAGRAAPDEIERLSLRISPRAREILEFDAPTNPDEARFSGQYCAAVAVAQGSLAVADFEPAAVGRQWVATLIGRTEVIVDTTLPTVRSGHVTVVAGAGTWSEAVAVPRGDPSVGYTWAEAAEKFAGCTAGLLGEAEAATLLRLAQNLEGADDVAVLVSKLAIAGD